jgi:hypothetical protein
LLSFTTNEYLKPEIMKDGLDIISFLNIFHCPMVIPCSNHSDEYPFYQNKLRKRGRGENSSGTWNSKPRSRLGIHTSTSMYAPVEGFLIAEFFRELAITSVKKYKIKNV